MLLLSTLCYVLVGGLEVGSQEEHHFGRPPILRHTQVNTNPYGHEL